MGSVAETVQDVLAGRIAYEDGLDRLAVTPAGDVDAVLEAALRQAFGALFARGWQPVELRRVVSRRGDPLLGRLVTDGVAAHLAGFEVAAVDPRWRDQATELGASVWWTGGYLSAVAARWRVDRVTLLDAVLVLLETLRSLPGIDVLVPPPGTAGAAETQPLDRRVRARVRALLAKAESTEFPAEAEAFAGKAQELIARHSLAEAAHAPATSVPVARRVEVDHPYEDEKAALLDAVATANRCETVWSPELAFSTVFGFESDVEAVELLYTSLLVQVGRALARANTGKAFRRSFMIAYAARIRERLAAAAAVGVTADLLPVLVSREAQVRETVRAAFPRTVRTRGRRVDSRDGWDSGQAAADEADLKTG